MRTLLYGCLCVAVIALQGCFWHSHDREVVVPAEHSSTTVVSPQPSTTVTTTP